jgi:hypothetical protein
MKISIRTDVKKACRAVALLLAGLVVLSSCGPRNPELAREKKMVEASLDVLRSGTPMQRDSTIRTLYNVKNAQLLAAHLGDPDPNVKIGMVSALGYIKDKSTAPALNGLLAVTQDYLLSETVIYAIGEVCDTSSVPLLIRMMEDPAVNRDLRLSIPITLAAFHKTEAADRIDQAFLEVLKNQPDDIELCSYVAVGILELLDQTNVDKFRQCLPQFKEMAVKRKAHSGEDGIWTNFDLTIRELENTRLPSS